MLRESAQDAREIKTGAYAPVGVSSLIRKSRNGVLATTATAAGSTMGTKLLVRMAKMLPGVPRHFTQVMNPNLLPFAPGMEKEETEDAVEGGTEPRLYGHWTSPMESKMSIGFLPVSSI